METSRFLIIFMIASVSCAASQSQNSAISRKYLPPSNQQSYYRYQPPKKSAKNQKSSSQSSINRASTQVSFNNRFNDNFRPFNHVQTIQSTFPGGGTATVNNFGGASSSIHNFGASSVNFQPNQFPVRVNNVRPGQNIVENNFAGGHTTVNRFSTGGAAIQNNFSPNRGFSNSAATSVNNFGGNRPQNSFSQFASVSNFGQPGSVVTTRFLQPNSVIVQNNRGKNGQVMSQVFTNGGFAVQNN